MHKSYNLRAASVLSCFQHLLPGILLTSDMNYYAAARSCSLGLIMRFCMVTKFHLRAVFVNDAAELSYLCDVLSETGGCFHAARQLHVRDGNNMEFWK